MRLWTPCRGCTSSSLPQSTPGRKSSNLMIHSHLPVFIQFNFLLNQPSCFTPSSSLSLLSFKFTSTVCGDHLPSQTACTNTKSSNFPFINVVLLFMFQTLYSRHLCHCPLSTVVIHFRLPPELQKRLVSLLSSPVEQLQVLSSAVLRETLPLSGQELNYNQENIGQLNSHAAALLLSQVASDAYVVFSFIRIYFELYVGF